MEEELVDMEFMEELLTAQGLYAAADEEAVEHVVDNEVIFGVFDLPVFLVVLTDCLDDETEMVEGTDLIFSLLVFFLSAGNFVSSAAEVETTSFPLPDEFIEAMTLEPRS